MVIWYRTVLKREGAIKVAHRLEQGSIRRDLVRKR